jgi:U32 family peptidase
VDLVWKLPRITRDPYLAGVLPCIPALEGAGISACMVENIGTAMALRNAGAGFRLTGSIGLNMFNHAAVMACCTLFTSLTISPELSRDEITFLITMLAEKGVRTDCALIVQGTSEAMITEDCLQRLVAPCGSGKAGEPGDSGRSFLGLRDETGHIFPVQVDNGCRTRIGNTSEICLIDYLPSIRAAGINEGIIDARGRTPQYVRTITGLYHKAVTWTNDHPDAH